jgi:hypothetical protein
MADNEYIEWVDTGTAEYWLSKEIQLVRKSIRDLYPKLPPTKADLEGAKTLKIKIPFLKTKKWQFNFSFERTPRKRT